ncbi:MAG: serine hydrolase [Rikenellaceae bacterium]|nr:serine hydrolase [Rikenellaceae bacterium]
MKRSLLLALILIISLGAMAQPLSRISPEKAGFDMIRLQNADRIINESISKGEIPGAVLAIVKNDRMAYIKAYGNKSVYPVVEKMETNTIFDLASVSKSLGTTLSFMQLIEQGRIRLTDNVAMYIKGFQGYVDTLTGKTIDIRVIDLLTHSSGLPPYANVDELTKKYGTPSPEALLDYIATCKRDFKPTTQFQYSCLNFITLQNILQNVTGMKLCDYAQKNVFDVLGLRYTFYNPDQFFYPMIAPTEKQKDGSVLLGKVHDPLARIFNMGNSGNAGLFSNADDMAVIAAALMNGGEYNGHRILGKLTVETMRTVPTGFETLGRSLGWDNYSPYASNSGNLFHQGKTFGHTGYTGTSIIIDPVEKVAVILLTNRVHPEDKGSVVRLRALVANAVAGSIVK